MIIEGLEDRVPQAKGLRQRLLVVKSYAAEAGDDPDLKRLHGVVQSINGQGHADVTAAAGSTELWRISNQSPNDYIHLSIKGLKFRIVALDGAATGNDLPVDKVDVGPAMRMELLVDMPAAGDYPLMSGSTLTGLGRNMKTSRELAVVHVTGEGAPRETPVQTRAMTTPDLRQARLTASRTLVFGQKPGEEVYTINGLVFDHMRTDLRIPLGSTEEWTIRNDTDDMHSFHIHQVHFQVVSINGEPQPFDRMLDTVRLPERGYVVVRIAFTDPLIVGRFMLHCHVLKHEDRGMMQMVEVYDPKTPAMPHPMAPHPMAPGMVMGPHDHMAP